MRIRYRSSASKDAARERLADAQRAAGIPDREPDLRPGGEIDMRWCGGPHWKCERVPYKVAYRVTDAVTGAYVMRGPPKAILAAARERTPAGVAFRNLH